VVYWFWERALEDPALMQIKLSISASHRAAILESCGAPADMIRKPAQDALRLRVGTLKSVQELLQNKTKVYTGSTIFIISHLIVSEVRNLVTALVPSRLLSSDPVGRTTYSHQYRASKPMWRPSKHI
jgi:hypothetical protein